MATRHCPLKVAAFNIRAFGVAKMSKSDVASNIVKILHRYDIVLVQEVRDSSERALAELRNLLSVTEPWSYVASARVGRRTYQEQYVFFYRTKSLNITGQYLYDDSVHDYFQREPFSVQIQYYSLSKSHSRKLVLLGLHTQPESTLSELQHLPGVIRTVSSHFNQAYGVIAMGDFNADCSYLSNAKESQLEIFSNYSDFKSYIHDSSDTTVSHSTNCAYDRIVSLGDVDIRNTQVYDFEKGLDLDINKTLSVSDHYPVEFLLY